MLLLFLKIIPPDPILINWNLNQSKSLISTKFSMLFLMLIVIKCILIYVNYLVSLFFIMKKNRKTWQNGQNLIYLLYFYPLAPKINSNNISKTSFFIFGNFLFFECKPKKKLVDFAVFEKKCAETKNIVLIFFILFCTSW